MRDAPDHVIASNQQLPGSVPLKNPSSAEDVQKLKLRFQELGKFQVYTVYIYSYTYWLMMPLLTRFYLTLEEKLAEAVKNKCGWLGRKPGREVEQPEQTTVGIRGSIM